MDHLGDYPTFLMIGARAGFGIPKTKLLELLPAEMDNSIIELLDVAGYLTFREYDGLDDFFVYHTKMMSPDGSDFRYAEDVRARRFPGPAEIYFAKAG